MGQHQHVVGSLLHLAERMTRQQYRPPLVRETPDIGPQPADAGRVQAVGGLVEDEHGGITEHRGGQTQPLAHPQ